MCIIHLQMFQKGCYFLLLLFTIIFYVLLILNKLIFVFSKDVLN